MPSPFLSCLLCLRREREKVKVPPFALNRGGKSPASSSDSDFQVQSRENLKDRNIKSGPETTTTVLEIPDRLDHNHNHNTLPKWNPALVVEREGKGDGKGKNTYRIIENYPYPTLESDDEVIISNRAVGLNPIDWKSVDFNFCLPEFPWITGREMAGVVDAIGANVKDFKVGDRVWTSTYYRDRRAGCFQHYVTVPQHTVNHVPDNLDFASAACLGVAGLTAAMTLWKWLEVAVPPPCPPQSQSQPATGTVTTTLSLRTSATSTTPFTEPPGEAADFLLIWGGSAVTAQFAIQIAVLSGLQVIAVASEKTKSLVSGLGATHVVTRDGKTNSEIVAEVRRVGGDSITRGLDLVGTETATYCLQAMSQTRPSLFAPLAMIPSKAVIPDNIRVQTVEMKQFVLNPDCGVYARQLNHLVCDGLLVMPSTHVLDGGLKSIQAGLDRLKSGDMAGKKLVVSMTM